METHTAQQPSLCAATGCNPARKKTCAADGTDTALRSALRSAHRQVERGSIASSVRQSWLVSSIAQRPQPLTRSNEREPSSVFLFTRLLCKYEDWSPLFPVHRVNVSLLLGGAAVAAAPRQPRWQGRRGASRAPPRTLFARSVLARSRVRWRCIVSKYYLFTSIPKTSAFQRKS